MHLTFPPSGAGNQKTPDTNPSDPEGQRVCAGYCRVDLTQTEVPGEEGASIVMLPHRDRHPTNNGTGADY